MSIENFKNIIPITEDQINKEIVFLKELLNNYTDEIPEKVIHNEGNYKCRAAWWSLLNCSVDRLVTIYNFLPNKMVDRVNKVLNEYSISQETTGLVSNINVKEANDSIKEMIDFLEGKLKKNCDL